MHAPDVSLTAATLLAAVQMPIKVLARRVADAEERRVIERMYDELIAHGTVDRQLPEDDRQVRDLHARRSWPAPQPPVSKMFPFKPREKVVTRIDRERAVRTGGSESPFANVIPLRAMLPSNRRRSARRRGASRRGRRCSAPGRPCCRSSRPKRARRRDRPPCRAPAPD